MLGVSLLFRVGFILEAKHAVNSFQSQKAHNFTIPNIIIDVSITITLHHIDWPQLLERPNTQHVQRFRQR